MKYSSPLRYPGGKAGLTEFLSSVILRNDLQDCVYYEPYAGGAGAALGLLKEGYVSELFLNDADIRISAFWRSVLYASERFVETIHSIPVTMTEWHHQRDICAHPDLHAEFDVGFATFFMNRCNRSGVITGAGPIGGWNQTGKWRVDVRFNRNNLAERIVYLARQKDRIHINCQDAVDFLKAKLPRGRGRSKIFVYLDPPYVQKGQRLYLNSYNHANHVQLAQYMYKQITLPWIMSYDDNDLVRELYIRYKVAIMSIQYSLQEKRPARELIITPHHVSVPKACTVRGKESLLHDVELKGVSK
jgi:DNA adenine methylase